MGHYVKVSQVPGQSKSGVSRITYQNRQKPYYKPALGAPRLLRQAFALGRGKTQDLGG
jgi:hypothetical protein